MSIRLSDICFGYSPDKSLFRNLNLTIPAKSWTAVTGDCGSGKSTLVKLISGLLKQWSGEIVYPNSKGKTGDLAFGYLFQNPDDQFVHFNIEREVAFSLENLGYDRKYMFNETEKALRQIKLWDRRADSPNNLSGGEKQRLALAGMMITDPMILIFDEPTAYLDISSRLDLYKQARELVDKGKTLLWITQNIDEIVLSDYVIKLQEGDVVFSNSLNKYLNEYMNMDHEI